MSKKRPIRRAKKTAKSTEPYPLQFTGIKVEPFPAAKTVAQLVEEECSRREELAKRVAAVPVTTVRISRTISWPLTWWDHFKQDVFPLWAKARWPVQFEERVYWEQVLGEQCQTTREPPAIVLTGEPITFTLGPNADDSMIKALS